MKIFQLISKQIPLVVALLIGGFIYIVSSCNSGPPENSLYAQTQRGKELFMQYCVDCHGEDGKGVAVDSLSREPADLTLIQAIRRTENFPVVEIANKIDGRKVAAHGGQRDMPIWGERFVQDEIADESEVKGKLAELVAYLMSIQK